MKKEERRETGREEEGRRSADQGCYIQVLIQSNQFDICKDRVNKTGYLGKGSHFSLKKMRITLFFLFLKKLKDNS